MIKNEYDNVKESGLLAIHSLLIDNLSFSELIDKKVSQEDKKTSNEELTKKFHKLIRKLCDSDNNNIATLAEAFNRIHPESSNFQNDN